MKNLPLSSVYLPPLQAKIGVRGAFYRYPYNLLQQAYSKDKLFILVCTRSRKLRTQKLKSHLVRTQSLSVLPLKPVVGQYIVIHATLPARDFFLAYFYPSGTFTAFFTQTSPDFFCVGCD